MNTLHLTVPFPPTSWKSHQGYGKRSFNPRYKERKEVQRIVRELSKNAPIFEGPLAIVVSYYLKLPKTMLKKIKGGLLPYPDKRPDLTNYHKFFEDCLNGVIIKDDGQIVRSTLQKLYTLDEPRIECTIQKINC